LTPAEEHRLVRPHQVADVAQESVELTEIPHALRLPLHEARVLAQVGGDRARAERRHRARGEVALDARQLPARVLALLTECALVPGGE
jgi:hypothetical protein